MAEIVWLASYPKSGNTWLRAFLTNYLRNQHEPVSINDLGDIPIASSRLWFDDIIGVEASQLLDEEILAYRPAFYRRVAMESAETLYLKIHDAYTTQPNGEPIIPTDVTQGAIYILRNPLDVAISFSHHNNQSIAKTIQLLNNPQAALAHSPQKIHEQLPQYLLTWSQHAQSWLEQTAFPVHCIRYEDMQNDPFATFSAVVQFLKLPNEPERIARSIQFTAFENLQEQEKKHGFRERQSPAPFFRQGHAGQWQNRLTSEQITSICQEHAASMQRFGYLSPTGEIITP